VVADDAVGRIVGAGDAALDLGIVDALGQHRERLRRLIAWLHLHRGPVDGAAVEPRRRSGLEPSQRKSEPLQGERQAKCGRLAHPACRRLPLADMDEPAQEGSRGEQDGPCPKVTPIRELEPGDSVAADQEIVRLGFDHRQIRHGGDRLLHGPGIEPAVCLRAWPAHGWPFPAIEHAKLDAAEISDAPHKAVERVDLAHEMALTQASDRGIARHRADGREAMGDERDLGAHARGGRGGLAAGMAAAHDDDIVPRVHRSKSPSAELLPDCGWSVHFQTMPRLRWRVSRETSQSLNAKGVPRSSTGPCTRLTPAICARYLPIQKSRKITSRTSSTSTRPRSLPNALLARRSCSAMISSLPSCAALCAPCNASAVALRCARWRSRVTKAGSGVKRQPAKRASALTNSSTPAPVVLETKLIISFRSNPDSILRFTSFSTTRSILLTTSQTRDSGGAWISGRCSGRESIAAASMTHSTRFALAACSLARRTPSRSIGSFVSRMPAVSSTVTG